MAFAAHAAIALGLPTLDDTPQSEAATQADASEANAVAEEIPLADRLPPGFKVKKRGKFTLYCKTETPLGTRFKSEQCLNDVQMRDYLIALQENKSDVDRMRQICSNPCTCGQTC
jgi:hypothetical protein